MNKKKLFALFLVLALTAGLLAGCGGNSSGEEKEPAEGAEEAAEEAKEEAEPAEEPAEETAEETGEEAAEEPAAEAEGKHANIAFRNFDEILDPGVDYAGWLTIRVGVGETLFRLDKDLHIEPWLAESYENPDELTWIIHLKDGITFSNGKAVTAEEVKKSIERSIRVNGTRAADYIKEDEIIADGLTLTIKTTAPVAAMINNLIEPVFCIVDADVDDATMAEVPVGTGPYVVTGFAPNETVDLAKNENYWNGEVGLDTITAISMTDENAKVYALQTGEIDIANYVSTASMSLFEGNPDYYTESVTGVRVLNAYMNNAETSPFTDVNLRKAVSYAVDYDAYATMLGFTRAHGMYSDALPFGNENLKGYDYEPETAKTILAENGYEDKDGDGYVEGLDGQPLTLHLIISENDKGGDYGLLATAIQSNLKDVGLNIEIQSMENISDRRSSGDFDMYFSLMGTGSTGYPDYPKLYFRSDAPNNWEHYSNPEVDQLIDEMENSFDIEENYKIAEKISQHLLDDAALLFLANNTNNLVASSKYKNILHHSIDFYIIDQYLTME